MPHPDDLHALIHSLDQAEKRYFKVRAAQHTIGESNNSVRLFDALLAQPQYDREAILHQFEGEGIARNLASEKNYLLKLILRAMRGYHAERNIDNQLNNLLVDLRFLSQKRLYPTLRKTLKKAKKLALQFERFPKLLEILLVEREFIKESADKTLTAELTELIAHQQRAVAAISDLWNHIEVYDRHFLLIRKAHRLRGKTPLEELETLRLEPLFQVDPSTIKSFHAKLYHHLLKAFYYQMRGDVADAQAAYASVLQVWEAHPHEISDDPFNFLKSIANFLMSCHLTNDYAQMLPAIQRIQAIKTVSFRDKMEQFIQVHHFSLIHAFNTADWERLDSLKTPIKKGLVTFDKHLSQARKSMFRYNLFVLHFIREEFSEALTWVNAIVHDADSQHRQDIQLAGRIFLLVLHYELGNDDLLDYLYRSVHRYIVKNAQMHAFETAILAFLRNVRRLPAGASPHSLLAGFDEELAKLASDPVQRNAAGLEELHAWVRARVRGISLLDVLAQSS